jgi:hypothetical protein
MKKRLLILVGLLLYLQYSNAQTSDSEPQVFIGNAAVNYESSATGSQNLKYLQMQIGNALHFSNTIVKNTNITIGFPYNVLYIPLTFVVDDFEISKGYFSEHIKLSWRIGANEDKITSIEIRRRVLSDNTSGFETIATLSATTFEYLDTQVEGGVLFEYQVIANGVPVVGDSLGERALNYMDGIGYRNPTATISGGVSYDSGSPVQDVTVFAEANGEPNSTAKSIGFEEDKTGAIVVENIDNITADKITLQAWVTVTGREATIFILKSNLGLEYRFRFGMNSDAHLHFSNILKPTSTSSNIVQKFYIKDYFPTGELNSAGKDIIKRIKNLEDSDFVHVSIVIEQGKTIRYFINGREINQEYIEEYDRIGLVEENTDFVHTIQTGEKFSYLSSSNYRNSSKSLYLKIDEIRAWNKVLTNEEIRRDYRRTLDGSEGNLALYLRMDEGSGEFLYDISKVGFSQNKNDAYLSGNYTFDDTTPTKEQLGVFGVTDANGSYIISGIPFKGTGESFVITPSLGVHQFEPASQTLFVGKNEPVVNQVNFKDISSFNFRGKVVYNVQGVFNPIASTDPTDLRDYGYNKYLLGDVIINKGEYYYEGGSVNSSTGFYEGGKLKQYPVIPLEGASILIDGNPVFDADNQLVLSDNKGEFLISVPIGNHKIEVVKDGHVFELDGRFPEEGTYSFFEDQIETQYFIDVTRVSLVGRVVGGKNEFEKPIGFGFDGLSTHINNQGETTETTEIISSVNNIGVAQITFKGDLNSSDLDKIITTNSETGEYKVDLIPYQYTIDESSGIIIDSNTNIDVLGTENESLDLREVSLTKESEFTTEDGTTLKSDPYHFEKSFRYNSDVSLILLNQEYETELLINGVTYDISNLEVPIYIQKEAYNFTFEVIQKYINKDDSNNLIETKEYYTEGAFNITNNIADTADNTETVSYNDNKYTYTFYGGIPNITQSEGFQKNISIEYNIPGQNALQIENSSDFKNLGIIKGGKASDGKTFVTTAPELPSIILRDPPGTNSFATLERGTSITYEEKRISNETEYNSEGYFVSVGPNFVFNKGFIFSVESELDIVAETSGTFSETTENIDENTMQKTFTINQTISTSDDPEFVGASGDLFIGNASNIYYGLFDNMFITEEIPKDNDNNTISNIPINVTDSEGNSKTLYVFSYKDFFVAEQPTSTFFTYSQKYILETLIPNLEALAANPSSADPDEERSPEFYRAQIDLWKKVIQDNERSKYLAGSERDALKDGILNTIAADYNGGNNVDLNDLLDQEFYSNRSFDAGLGELTNSVTTTVVNSTSYQTIIDIEDEFQAEAGAFYNDMGATYSYNKTTNSITDNTNTSVLENTTTISYTLKDNDDDNLLSVDIVNMFDGSGPIFITKGGATSCPYEGEEISVFFNIDDYENDNEAIGSGGVTLSEATNRVYDSELNVVKNNIVNVPEDDAAVFTLLLKNTSQTQSDLEFVLDFDPTTLNGAEISLETNGTTVYLPYNETIEFPIEISKTSSSSRYLYEDIRIFLYGGCATEDEKHEIFVDVSAEFKKSCSNVSLSVPEDNWVFNANEAYITDSNGNTITNKLPITFTDFNTDFNGFERISLQYRNTNSSSWTKLQSYYGSQTLKDEAGDTEGIVISGSDSEFTFNWDVVGNNIPDGDYEFRAVSFCTDNISNTSEISSGVINLTAPVVFGTPKPSDGILDVGEDVSVRFNEAIFEGTSTSITVTGLKNQQEVDNSVSVYLNNTPNQIELPNQILQQGNSLTLQFWYKNATTGSGTLVSQEDGFNINVNGNHLEFSIGGETISTASASQPIDNTQYNFYSFIYQKKNNTVPAKLLIYQNGAILNQKELTNDLDINTDASLFVGGNNVLGNIHNIRMWTRSFTPAEATVSKDLTLTGRELNLTGYWKLDEGYGNTALDIVKRKNASIHSGWDIFPKGTSWEFKNDEYLELNNVNFVQISEVEDITLSFWIRADEFKSGTIFSNGFGNDQDALQSNGFRNKWAVNIDVDGNLELKAENVTYPLTTLPLKAKTWTHVAIILRRGGTIKSYINGDEITSVSSRNLGGLYGGKYLIGARLFEDEFGEETHDNQFNGLLDEIRLWNTARSVSQIKRDQYFEIDKETEGLLLYMDCNEDPNNTSAGPAYHHKDVNETIGTTFSILTTGSPQEYRNSSPSLKPQLQFTNIPYSTVINGDEMIITPSLTEEEWTLFEGQEINFTVSRLTDQYFNKQLSPVTWTALVNRQELKWYTQENTKEIDTEKNVGEAYSFTMTIDNIGGSTQPYSISGIPVWMQTDNASGEIPANTSREITFTVDENLAMGNYTTDLFLQTESGFNDRLSFSIRALQPAPDWSVNPRDFNYSINIIGQIQIKGVISRDKYTKVGAFIDNEQRGEAILTYDEAYDSYFVFLTAYSNNSFGDVMTFKIWDAIEGKSLIATIDEATSIAFTENQILGRKSTPKIFSGNALTEQSITLNEGWTWTSFFVNDTRFSDISELFSEISDYEEASIKNLLVFTSLENGAWNGSLNTLSTAEMYKIKLSEPYELKLSGEQVDETAINFEIYEGWNWLPFPIHKNISLLDALAFYEPTDGDVIKDQFNFAIYDASSGWSGTLDYLIADEGYMLRSYKEESQTFNYPDTRNTSAKTNQKQFVAKQKDNHFRQYQYNMNIVAEITTEEIFDKVLVLDTKGELRGYSEIVNLNGKRYSFITAFSNESESLQFVLENTTNKIYTAITTTFINDAIIGSVSNPFQINLNSLSNTDIGLHSFAVFPNPFKDEITINFSNNTSIETIEVYTVLGISVKKQNVKGLISTNIDTKDFATGIYLIKVTSVDGKSVIQKIIKR